MTIMSKTTNLTSIYLFMNHDDDHEGQLKNYYPGSINTNFMRINLILFNTFLQKVTSCKKNNIKHISSIILIIL